MTRPTAADAARPTAEVLAEVRAERARQDARWGEQNHPDGTDTARATHRDEVRDRVEAAFDAGRGTWRHILAEEVAEAFAEEDPARLRAELIQVAAVACAWVEALDRRKATD